MVKSHDKFDFDEAKTAHFLTKRRNILQPTRLALHTQNSEKPTTDFVFDFSRVMSGQKMQISSWQKVCQRFHLIRQPIFLHDFFFYVGKFF